MTTRALSRRSSRLLTHLGAGGLVLAALVGLACGLQRESGGIRRRDRVRWAVPGNWRETTATGGQTTESGGQTTASGGQTTEVADRRRQRRADDVNWRA